MRRLLASLVLGSALLLAGGCGDRASEPSPPPATEETPAQPPPDVPVSLAGRWEPVEQASGGISGVLDLLDDGTFVSGLVVQVTMDYTLKGNRLTVSGGDDEKAIPGAPSGVDVTFQGDRMMVPGEPTKTRIGTAVPGTRPIIGVWTYTHYTGGPAFERYGTNGKLDLRIPMPGETRGRYTVSGSTLTLDSGGKKSSSRFEGKGDLLTLTPIGDARGPQTVRFTPRWYRFPLDDADNAQIEKTLKSRGALPEGK